jgi:hypothetical protein
MIESEHIFTMMHYWTSAIVLLVLGIHVHLLVLIRGEWHLHVPQILFSHLIAFSLLSTTLTRNQDWLSGVSKAAFPSACYLMGLFTSIVAYRLFFHRLRKFPGPKIAAATKLWHVWKCRDSRNFLVMQRVYEQYGELVRTGPNE